MHNQLAAVRTFDLVLNVAGKEWKFEVRRYPSTDPRFEGIASYNNQQRLDFIMIRTSIGKWLMHGGALPYDMVDHSQEIGNAFHEHGF
ncbi:MAG TPA: hypothetical protein VM101_02590 [Flavitalea sp.]|nr:hypothetical protein [Flavitalea sp.]